MAAVRPKRDQTVDVIPTGTAQEAHSPSVAGASTGGSHDNPRRHPGPRRRESRGPRHRPLRGTARRPARPRAGVRRRGRCFDRRRVLGLFGGLGASGGARRVRSVRRRRRTTSSSSSTSSRPPPARHARPAPRAARRPPAARPKAELPEETAGPFPGDGTNGADALELSGIVRSDIRTSIARRGQGNGRGRAPDVHDHRR